MPLTRLNGSLNSIWVADFETTTDPDDCRVWGWGVCNLDDTERIEIGNDIASFVAWASGKNAVVYFHNLRFDGRFIIDYLLRNKFTHSDSRPRRGEFATLISDSGQFYSITVRWGTGKQVEFRDSLKKLPMPVSGIAKAFNLADSKGEIDYHTYRPVGHVLTEEEKDYLIKDVRIVAQALAVQLNQGMTKLTVGSDSLAEFKTTLSKKMFDRMFPILPLTMDSEIRRAYRGGFTYADARRRGEVVGPGRAYDVNSLYPAVMYDRLLPYGEPIFCDGLPEPTDRYPLFIVSITFTAKLKPNKIPCIQVKASSFFLDTEYQTEINEPVTLSCTNVDLALWEEHYDLDILSYNGGWLFRGITGVFSEYIDKWSKVKNENEGGLRTIAKLHLNSLYGKFATNPNVTPRVPILENNVVRLVTGPEEERNPVYTAMGVFITAYARDVTIRAAQRHYGAFLYADTDSLHLAVESDPPTLDVDPSRLGAWKYEYSFERALFARAKAYTVENPTKNGKPIGRDTDTEKWYVTHVAGMPEPVQRRVRFHHYKNGHKFEGKLLPVAVPGGIVLHDVGFTLKALV